MKNVFIAILLLFLLTFKHRKEKEGYENRFENVGNIGNLICDYYYNYVMCILQKKDFEWFSDNEFIKLFPKKIIFNEDIYNKLKEKKIEYETYKDHHSLSFWNNKTNEQKIIHEIMQPYMYNIFNTAFVNSNLKTKVDYPIIHFRCADTPFMKHQDYYFQNYNYFKKGMEEIKQKVKFDKIVILSCSTHQSTVGIQKACATYSHLLKEALNEYKVEIQCGNIVEDFVKMFYAPAVISTISSFSYMSGFFGGGVFIIPSSITNNREIDELDSHYKGFNILHDSVSDYHNIDEVYKLLIT